MNTVYLVFVSVTCAVFALLICTAGAGALEAWLRRARSDIIGSDGSTYMRRWKLLRTPWFQIRVHHILRSDRDDALHDHPAAFVSLVLRGGYEEVVPALQIEAWWRRTRPQNLAADFAAYLIREVRPGQVVVRRAADLHRLVLRAPHTAVCRGLMPLHQDGSRCVCGALPRPAWTLVLWLHPRGERPWGYVPPGERWVPSHVYHARTGASLRRGADT